VPVLQHAGLALSIGLGALVNAGCCWRPVAARQLQAEPGWGKFALQVFAATALLASS
jgi:putative peptidoglycan lipid II flippase